MSVLPGLLVTLPRDEDEAIFWWDMADGQICARGEDLDPLSAAGRDAPGEDRRIVALVAAADCTVRSFAFDDLPPAQAEGAARLKAAEASIGGREHVHVAARWFADGEGEGGSVLTAATSAGQFARGLAILQRRGLDPDAALPASLVPPVPEAGVVEAEIGGESVLRGAEIACIDEAPLRAALVGDRPVVPLEDEARDRALREAFVAPAVDFRSGPFRKRRARIAVTPRQWRVLAALAGFVLLGSLLIGLTLLAKYSLGAEREDARALAEARAIVPEATDLAAAEQELRQRLAARGLGALTFTVPSSALYAALEEAPAVALRQLSYEPGGLVSASLSAARPEDINTALIALQRDGYVITANSRREATGETWADITVRAP